MIEDLSQTAVVAFLPQAVALGLGALICAAVAAWVDHRTQARLEGRRRLRNGLWGSFARAVAMVARDPQPRFWRCFVAAFSLLSALLWVAILLRSLLMNVYPPGGTAAPAPGASELLWWMALLLSAAASSRWASASTETQRGNARNRWHLENATPLLGLSVALGTLLLGVGLLPGMPHPLAVVVLIVAAGLWRRLDARGHHTGITAGGVVGVFVQITSHLLVAALTLAAITVSGVQVLLAGESVVLAGGSIAAMFLVGIFLSRFAATTVLSSPTPPRLRTFTWGRLLPLALAECLLSATLLAQGVGG